MTGPTPLTSPRLAALPGVRHAFFTRDGGVSRGIYARLNVGQGSADDPVAVAENRRRCAEWFGAEPRALHVAWQVHSATVLTVDAPWVGDRPRGDAVVTARPGLVCGALAADCAPILLADATARVVGATHAGWRGALAGVAEATVAAMVALGADPGRIVATVGPCIGQASYEVGAEFVHAVWGENARSQRFFVDGLTSGKSRFDLAGYVVSRLARAGVEAADALARDTCAEEETFFSNRRAHHRGEADYGRLLSAIALL